MNHRPVSDIFPLFVEEAPQLMHHWLQVCICTWCQGSSTHSHPASSHDSPHTHACRCTACYRKGRTGEAFMKIAKAGEIHNFCHPNSLLTLQVR